MTNLRQVLSSPWLRIAVGMVVVGGLLVGAGALLFGAAGQNLDTSRPTLARVATLGAMAVAIAGVLRYGGEGYLASLWIFAPMTPPLAASVSVVSYLLAAEGPQANANDRIDAVLLGLAVAIFGWFLSAYPGAQLASRRRAQMRIFDDLVERYDVLEARVRAVRARNELCPPDDECQPKELFEADALLKRVAFELFDPAAEGPALRWAMSSGYTGLTKALHRVEEALFTVEEQAELIGDVLHDDLSLEDSGLRNRFALRRIIRDALPVIAPGVAERFLRPVPALPQASAISEPAPTAPSPLSPQAARQALREVRFAINRYRDDITDSFARGRNRVLWTYLAVSISTYVLLGLGLLFGIPHTALVSVSVLYLVGSLIGLFSRLRIESTNVPRVEDYGLYFARLVTGPLLSGLAGVAGVYLIAQAPAFLGPLTAGATVAGAPGASPGPFASLSPDVTTALMNQLDAPRQLAEVYDLTRNQLAILVAAIFGLGPGLLTARLQAQVNRMERDLARSEPATSAATTGSTGDSTSEDEQG